jgi:hypothetical protein
VMYPTYPSASYETAMAYSSPPTTTEMSSR